MMKKIFFPFFQKNRHSFLMQKWWFRMLIAIYIIGMIVLLIFSWIYTSDYFWGWCYDGLFIYTNNNDFNKHFLECHAIGKENFLYAIFSTFSIVILIHYIIQLMVFKIIIDFIALGHKK